jgi:hypothetical protein
MVFPHIHMKHMNSCCEKISEILLLEICGIYIYICILTIKFENLSDAENI